MISVEEGQLSAISAAAKTGCEKKRALNPADPGDASAIRALLSLTGKTEESHPGLHGDLEAARCAEPAPDDHDLQALQIVDAGRTADGRATARVWHLDREGTFMAGSLALVLDEDSGRPLALGFANRVGGGLCPAATRGDTAQPATDRIRTIGFYHSQPTPGAVPRFGLITRVDILGETNDGRA
jgi:hypothetical protein